MSFQFKLPSYINPVSLFWGIYTPIVIMGYYELFTKLFDKVQ